MKLKCSVCGREYDADNVLLECPYCRGNLIFKYDDEAKYGENIILEKLYSIWRYNILPLNWEEGVSMGEGMTPLNKASNLSTAIGFKGNLLLKNEAMNPTGSFIDRGVSVTISHALLKGYERVVTASPGNLGASLSAYAAKAGMKTLIYIPHNIESGKLYQILMYKGDVVRVKNLEEGVEKARKLFDDKYYPVFPNNPYYFEGVKTIAYEVIERLGWRSPDLVITPMGSGALIYSIYKGFKEALDMGIVDNIPRLVGVQVRGSSMIVDRLLGETQDDYGESIPELSLKSPLNMNLAIKAIKDTGGTALKISYEEAVKGLEMLSEKEGILVEIAAASTIAGLSGVITEYDVDTVVCILTGEGLKDPVTVRELTNKVRRGIGIGYGEISRIGRTKLRILRAVEDGYNYGYVVWKHLGREGVKITLPTVYQHLLELEKMRLIKLVSKIGLTKEKSIYRLTRRGREVLRYMW